MKIKLKKALINRQVVLGLLVMIIITAGIINWATSKENEEALPVVSTDIGDFADILPLPEPETPDYFAQARFDRDVSRGQALELLESTRDNSAFEDIRKISQNIQTEALIEGLIRSKGFENAIAYVGEDYANVIVQAKGLTPPQVAQIKDIITSQSGLSADKIRIAEISGE
jgi:stage III sporulation protein AH